MAVVKDMALTFDDFKRGLGAALDGQDCRFEGQRALIGAPDKGVTIDVTPLPPRRLGGFFVVEHSEIKISFQGFDEAEQDAFLQRFDRAFQRGGG